MGTGAIPPPTAGFAASFTQNDSLCMATVAASLEAREAWSLVCRWRGR